MQRDAQSCDLLIIGASFAGLVAARTAAMRGLDVVVLEAKPEAGARVATTGILVKEAAEEIDLPHTLTRRVHGVRLHAPSLRHIDLFSPGSFFLTTDTANLLRWLADEALRAGVRIRYGARFAGAARRQPAPHRRARPRSALYSRRRWRALGGGAALRARPQPAFSGRGRGRVREPRHRRSALPALLPRSQSGSGLSGLRGARPAPDAGRAGGRRGKRVSLSAFLARTEPIFGFARAHMVERRAGRIPAGGVVHPWSAPGVLLVGDAAGMVSPATGGGIRLAFQFGRRAAQTIADHLLHLGPAPETVLAREVPRFRLKQLMRLGLDLALPDLLVNAAIATSPMRWLAAHVYFHRRSATGISFAEFEARLAVSAEVHPRPAPSTAG